MNTRTLYRRFRALLFRLHILNGRRKNRTAPTLI